MRFARIVCAGLLATMSVNPAWPATAETAPSSIAPVLISRGEHKIAFYVIPGSRGTIVLDSGSGQDASHWEDLAPQLAARTGYTVISYDRAGLGASDEVPGPWDVHAAVADLAHGLETLGATRNVILVSHSLSGMIATYLTAQRPEWFSGAVLVDANIPDFFTDETMAIVSRAYDPIVARMRAGPSTRETRVFLALVDSWHDANRAYHRAEWPNGVPVTVIVAEGTPFRDADSARRWREAQAQFARRARNRRLVDASGSSHDVVHDRPNLILEAITTMAAEQR